MQYSWPYALVGIVLIVFSLLWKREQDTSKKRHYFIAVLCILVFFLCFRGLICEDWPAYYTFFYECSTQDIANYFSGNLIVFEPGYTLLNIICKRIYPSYFFLTFVLGIIDLWLLSRFAKNRVDNIPLFLLLFFVFDGIAIYCNQYRNLLAILIFLNALPFLEQRKPLPYFLLCLLALTFHISAIFYFPIYFFFRHYPNKWIYLSIFVFCNAFFLLRISLVENIVNLLGLSDLFQSKITTYTETYNVSRRISFSFVEHLVIGTLIFCFYDKFKEKRHSNGIYINAIIVYFLFYYLLGEFKEMSTRLSYLFIYGYWILWIDLIGAFAIKNNRRLWIFFVYLYCVVRLLIICRDPDYKYENTLFGSSSYQERLHYHSKNNAVDDTK